VSQYTPVTSFVSKDALISGNPLKALKGADFTTEFTAIQTALNSKFDGSFVFGPDGTAAQPSFGFTNNAGTGMYNAAGVLGFAAGAAQRVSISAVGLVTINAPSSGTALTVSGATNSVGQEITSNEGRIRITATAASGKSYEWASGGGSLLTAGSFGLFDVTRATFPLALSTSGNFTISAPSGGPALTVTGTTTLQGQIGADIQIKPAGAGATTQSAFQYNPGDNNLYIDAPATGTPTGGSTRLRVGAGFLTALNLASTSGIFTNGATGGDQGSGTLNATGLFVNGVSVGATAATYKVAAATETRTSTTTLSNSTQLTAAIAAAGTYAVKALLFTFGGGGGMTANVNYSGTFTANSSMMQGNIGPSGTTEADTNFQIASAVTTSLLGNSTNGTNAIPQTFVFDGTLTATGAGTLAVAFSQFASNAAATTLGIGSYMQITKIV
jgi:hypothetical protein